MKKILFALVAMFSMLTASAQFQMDPAEMAKRQADQMKETCKLDTAQYNKILKYYQVETKAMMARMDSMMNAGGGMPQFDPADMQRRQEAQDKAIKAILTEEQFKAYKKAQEERMARMRQGGFGGFGGGQ